jgi:hypothetical protein
MKQSQENTSPTQDVSAILSDPSLQQQPDVSAVSAQSSSEVEDEDESGDAAIEWLDKQLEAPKPLIEILRGWKKFYKKYELDKEYSQDLLAYVRDLWDVVEYLAKDGKLMWKKGKHPQVERIEEE